MLPLNVGRHLFLYFAQKLDCSMAPGHEKIVHISLKIILNTLSITHKNKSLQIKSRIPNSLWIHWIILVDPDPE